MKKVTKKFNSPAYDMLCGLIKHLKYLNRLSKAAEVRLKHKLLILQIQVLL